MFVTAEKGKRYSYSHPKTREFCIASTNNDSLRGSLFILTIQNSRVFFVSMNNNPRRKSLFVLANQNSRVLDSGDYLQLKLNIHTDSLSQQASKHMHKQTKPGIEIASRQLSLLVWIRDLILSEYE